MHNEEHSPKKVVSVRRQIRAMAMASGVGAKLPTVRALCSICEASISTVDRAMHDLEAQGILVRRHGSGIFIAPTALHKRICVLMGSDLMREGVSPIYPALIARVAQVGRERRWDVSPHIAMSPGGEDQPIRLTRELRYALDAGFVDGAITTVGFTPEMEEAFRGNDVPVAAFLPTVRTPAVIGVDYQELVRMGIRELVALGRRRIALVTVLGLGRRHGFTEDLTGYASGLAACGLASGDELIRDITVVPGDVFNEATGQRWRQHGYRSAISLLDLPEPPDGIVVTDDMAAAGVAHALRERGVAEVAVASHMNRGSPVLVNAGVTLVGLEFDPGYIADRLISLLDDLLHQREGSDRTELIQPQLRSDLLGIPALR